MTAIRRLAIASAKAAPEIIEPSEWGPLAYSDSGPVSILTRITPDLAAKMLESNTHNRTVNDLHVSRLGEDMKNGKWIVTHQGLAWDATGTLIDGQHRLWAVLGSKTSVVMMCAYNVDPDALKVIDTGKTRTVGQTLDLVSGRKNGRLVTSRSAVIRSLEARRVVAARVMTQDVEEIYARHEAGLTWSTKALPGIKGGESAPVAGALAFCYPTNPGKMDAFAAQVRLGEMLSKSDPAYALRRLIVDQSASAQEGRWVLALGTVRCVYAYLHDESISVLKPKTLIDPSADKSSVIEEALRFFERVHKGNKPERGVIGTLPKRRPKAKEAK